MRDSKDIQKIRAEMLHQIVERIISLYEGDTCLSRGNILYSKLMLNVQVQYWLEHDELETDLEFSLRRDFLETLWNLTSIMFNNGDSVYLDDIVLFIVKQGRGINLVEVKEKFDEIVLAFGASFESRLPFYFAVAKIIYH